MIPVRRKVLNEKGITDWIFLWTLSAASFWAVLYQNDQILFGMLIGSSLFRLLAVGGIERTGASGEWKSFRGSGQFLVFSVILLLFLSADYLLSRNAGQNTLSWTDGVVLIVLFIGYWYLVWGRTGDGVWSRWRERKMADRGKRMAVWSVLLVGIVVGSALLVKGISNLGIAFEIAQYKMGMTLLAWSVNLPVILLKPILSEEEKNREELPDFVERNTGEAIFSLTLLSGIAALFLPTLSIRISIDQIYDLIGFAIIALLLQLSKNIDNRLAGSGMAAVYVGYVIHVFIR